MSPGTRIYADYNATAPLRLEAKAAMVRALEMTGNPSSVHAEGRKARALVYFIQDRKRVKIGYSTNPQSRLRALMTHTTLKLLATEPGGAKREAELHKKFSHLRTSVGREWFYLKSEILDYIKSLKTKKS